MSGGCKAEAFTQTSPADRQVFEAYYLFCGQPWRLLPLVDGLNAVWGQIGDSKHAGESGRVDNNAPTMAEKTASMMTTTMISIRVKPDCVFMLLPPMHLV